MMEKNFSTSQNFDYDAYKEHLKELQEQWLTDNDYQGVLVAPGLIPLRPDFGFFIKVDTIEIPQEIFPEEFEHIVEAYHSVLEKLKKHHIERKAKTKL